MRVLANTAYACAYVNMFRFAFVVRAGVWPGTPDYGPADAPGNLERTPAPKASIAPCRRAHLSRVPAKPNMVNRLTRYGVARKSTWYGSKLSGNSKTNRNMCAKRPAQYV